MIRDVFRIRLPRPGRTPLCAALCCVALGISVVSGGVAQARQLVIETLEEPSSLAGHWRFQTGDDPAWSSPGFDDSDWDVLLVPGGWGRQGYRDHSGVAWYRLDLDLSQILAAGREDLRLGVQFGEVTSSYELYAGGTRIGGVGSLPPEPRMEYDHHRIYPLPLASIDSDGHLVLAIRAWRSSISRTQEGGPTRGPFFIGHLEQLRTGALKSEIPYLVLVAIFFAVGLYHLRIYAEHRGFVEHLWFGLFAVDIALYTLLRTQWKYELTDSFILLKNVEYMAMYLLPALGIQMVATLYSRPIGRRLRAYQLSFVALAALTGLTPGLKFNLMTISLGQLWLLPTLAYVGFVGFQEYRRGHPQATILGSVIFLGTCLFDIAADQDWVRGPRMIPVGMTVMIFSMAASLANRLIRAHNDLETLTTSLEAQVSEQTFQLRERAEQLELKNRLLEEAQDGLREASYTDPLTGLNNRRFLTEYLPHDVARVLREYGHVANDPAPPERTDLVFLLLDLDYFKAVNDHHGHDAGDRVLNQTAGVLRVVCRKSDFIVRWGGEEFLVVSRFVDRLGAAILAERIREAIATHRFDIGDGRQLRQTCSVGFASFPLLAKYPDEIEWHDVVSIADSALYAAKNRGRDGWVGISEARGEPGDGLARRLQEDFTGCVSQGDIQCQMSELQDEIETDKEDTSRD